MKIIHKSFTILGEFMKKPDIHLQKLLYNEWKNENSISPSRGSEEIKNSIAAFVETHTPLPTDVSLTQCISDYHLPDGADLVSRLKRDNMMLKVTIDGLYLSKDDTLKLQNISLYYRPLKTLFFNKLPNSTPQNYGSFRRKQQRNGNLYNQLCIWSGSIAELYYPEEKESIVSAEILKWNTLNAPPVSGISEQYLMVPDAAKLLSIDASKLYDWLLLQKDCGKVMSEQLFLKSDTFNEMKEQKSNYKEITPLIRNLCKDYKKITTEEAVSLVVAEFPTMKCKHIVSGSQYIVLDSSKFYYDSLEELDTVDFIKSILNKQPSLPLTELIPITGYKLVMLKEKVTKKIIFGTIKGTVYCTSMDEFNRIKALSENYIGIELAIESAKSDCKVGFDFDKSKHRENLYCYISDNQWWSLRYVPVSEIPELNPGNNLYFIHPQDLEHLSIHLALWVKGYGESNDKKCRLLVNHFKNVYPDTCESLLRYFSATNSTNKTLQDTCTKEMMDFLFHHMDKELESMNDDEIKIKIIIPFSEYCSLVVKRMVACYLHESGYTSRTYDFEATGYLQNVAAYSVEAFSCMAYTTLNPDAWEQQSLIQKALELKKSADMWLFVALHFFAAWRTTDYIRIPCPPLYDPPEEVLHCIKEGKYTEAKSKKVTEAFLLKLHFLALTPNKTKHVAYVPELKIFIPTSCETVFGTILSIAAAHYLIANKNEQPDNEKLPQFIYKQTSLYVLRNFFGEKFSAACDDKAFSTRRANKALMQSVESASGLMRRKYAIEKFIVPAIYEIQYWLNNGKHIVPKTSEGVIFDGSTH